MPSLSSSSTDAEVWNAYDDNASYEEDGSPATAGTFVTACRILLRRRPANMAVDGESVAFDAQAIREQLSRAQNWLAVNRNAGRGGVRYLNFSGVRN